MMEATGWRFLPKAGGLLDQPEWFNDVLTIEAIHQKMKKMLGA